MVVFDLGLPHQHQVIDPIQTLLLTGRGRDAAPSSSTAASRWRTE